MFDATTSNDNGQHHACYMYISHFFSQNGNVKSEELFTVSCGKNGCALVHFKSVEGSIRFDILDNLKCKI